LPFPDGDAKPPRPDRSKRSFPPFRQPSQSRRIFR
jgi:hypothetical protein